MSREIRTLGETLICDLVHTHQIDAHNIVVLLYGGT